MVALTLVSGWLILISAAIDQPEIPQPSIDQKLILAFGPDCPELQRCIKLQLRRLDLIAVMDAGEITADGRLGAKDFSCVQFGSAAGKTAPSVALLMRSPKALLTFDPPLKSSLTEMGSSRLVKVELADGTRIELNRK